jgi:hypothetical protein
MAESNLKRVEAAHERRERFIKLHGLSRLHEIKLIYLMWKNKDFVNLGFETWAGYLQSPLDSGGLDLSRSWANEMVSVYEKYILELKQPEQLLLEVPCRKLYVMKERATADNVEEIVMQARTTPLKDLILVRDGIEEDDGHEHLWRCVRCKQYKTKQ